MCKKIINSNKVIMLIEIFLILSILCPLILATWYAIPAADDFSNLNASVEQEGGPLLVALKLTTSAWKTWQGTYFGCFLTYLCSPIIKNLILFRFFCFLNMLLFFGALYSVIHTLSKLWNIKNRKIKVGIFIATIISFCGFTQFSEGFYWLTGASVYTIPLSSMLIGISILICAVEKNSRKKYIVSGICFFLASGGSLQISSLGCCILLSILVIFWNKRSVRKNTFFVFCACFFGALFNAGAPGNFVRHENIADKIYPMKAITDSFIISIKIIENVLFETPFIVAMLIIFIVCVKGFSENKRHFKSPLLLIIALGVTLPATAFPVVLGYNGIGYFPNRCEFIMYLAIALGGMMCTLNVAAWFADKMSSRILILFNKKMLLWSCIGVFLINIFILGDKFIPGIIITDFANGTLETYSKGWESIYNTIEDAPSDNVSIDYRDIPKDLPYMLPSTIQVDWVQKSIAKYYQKETIQIVNE